jgi:hypothetical protein
MRQFAYIVSAALTVILTMSISNGAMLEPFISVRDLTDRSDWIGIVRIERRNPSKDSLFGPEFFVCSPIVRLKGTAFGDPEDRVTCQLIDGSARLGHDGKALASLSGGYKFAIGDMYLVFMNRLDKGYVYVQMEGSVLELPSGFSPEHVRGKTVKDAFLRVVSELESYYARCAQHAKLQKEVFSETLVK